jgi:hypothetical protein
MGLLWNSKLSEHKVVKGARYRRPAGLRRMSRLREEVAPPPQGVRRLPGLLAQLRSLHGDPLEVKTPVTR